MSAALKAIHVGVRELGLDDDTKRGLYLRVTNKSSAADMTEAEREKVVEALRQRGFKKALNSFQTGRTQLTGPFAKKLQALWIAAWNLGIVTNKDDAALLAFVKRQTKIDHTRFLRYPEDASKAIDALKAWMAREAGVDWSVSQLRHAYKNTYGFQIAYAQWKKLYGLAADCSPEFIDLCRGTFPPVQGQYSDRDFLDYMSDKRWQEVMNELGERIRQKQMERSHE